MAGLVPAIHVFFSLKSARKTWMPATSAGMTPAGDLISWERAPSRLFCGVARGFIGRAALILGALDGVFGNEIDRPVFDLGQHLADIFAHHADHQELNAADHHDPDDDRRIARYGVLVDEGLDQNPDAEHECAGSEQDASRLASRSGATEN